MLRTNAYSIASLARARSVDGRARSSDLAVLKLIVEGTTGRPLPVIGVAIWPVWVREVNARTKRIARCDRWDHLLARAMEG
jgi:hypothetical protein